MYSLTDRQPMETTSDRDHVVSSRYAERKKRPYLQALQLSLMALWQTKKYSYAEVRSGREFLKYVFYAPHGLGILLQLVAL